MGVLALPGALLIAERGGLPAVHWIRLTAAGAAVIGGVLTADFDRRWRRSAFGPVILAVTVLGIYDTVPDTPHAMVVFGTALPLLFLGWPWPAASLGSGGALATVGLLAWVVTRDGFGRQSSIVGAIACLGIFALEPMIRAIWRNRWSPLNLLPGGVLKTPVLAACQLALVFVAARVAGVRQPANVGPRGTLARGGVAESLAIVAAEVGVALIIAFSLYLVSTHVRRARRA
jgi:hypothetical protein